MDREARVRALLKECSNLEQVLAREVSCAATRVVDDCMQHWTNMLRANAVREDTMAANAVAMRREGGVCIESLRQGLNRLLSFPVAVVTITVLKGVSGEIRNISLRRMARADMADLVQMFELFTRFQFLFFDEDSLLSARGAESFKCFEDCISHFTHILNTSALHDGTMFTNVPVMQKNAGVCIESLRRALDQAVASAANISAGLELNNMISRKKCLWAVARMQKNAIMRAFYLFACSLRHVCTTGSIALDVWRTISREPDTVAHLDWRTIHLGVLFHGNAPDSHVRTFNLNINQWTDRSHP